MRKSKYQFAVLAFMMVVAVFVVLGCNNNPSTGPATADVKQAFGAMMTPSLGAASANSVSTYSSTGSGKYAGSVTLSDGRGGTVDAVYTSDAPPASGPSTINGTLTFTNWHDSTTGYRINGALTISEAISSKLPASTYTITADINYNLTLSGGTVTSLSGAIHMSIAITPTAPYAVSTFSGAIIANGYTYNVTQVVQ